jgi:cytochrome c nitrite reductase small subunit
MLHYLIPPPKFRFAVIVLLGIFAGLGAYTFYISRAWSYLSDAPETCINCHIMIPHYSGWFHSSHRRATNCNDCHVPQDNPISKYYFKAKDGLRHSYVFTLRGEPQVIRIKEEGREAVHNNCLRCHEQLFANPRMAGTNYYEAHTSQNCIKCHRSTPHPNPASISSTPNALTPRLGSPVPEWIRKAVK